MTTLKLEEIRTWLIEKKDEYQKLKLMDFPPIGNTLYFTYGQLLAFIEYYKFKHICEKALFDLRNIGYSNFQALSNWTKQYEVLGSQDLLMFNINYMDWEEQVSDDKIKILEGFYTYRFPFANIICFCTVFQHLYWNNQLHDTIPAEKEQKEIENELRNIISKFYFCENPS